MEGDGVGEGTMPGGLVWSTPPPKPDPGPLSWHLWENLIGENLLKGWA